MPNLQQIAQKYFEKQHIANIQNLNGHIIVTLTDAPENSQTADALKQELLSHQEVQKATIIFTRKKIPAQTAELQKWNLKNIRHIS